MAERLVKVTRKGQVTIPLEQRKKYSIREGMKLLVKDSPQGILLSPVKPVEDLAGIDAGKTSIEDMKKKLDKMRSEDRY
ncbi:MAG TPA: AbrB/MazE/SpoVT family DNA-binding domain-containing protein [Candidatus Bathyarchaeia archaeon]|nr:AbrB/MazE/SpoVT family DNA-binding domain-containing protein [Candidatus Bathyarchaeia archaeon]